MTEKADNNCRPFDAREPLQRLRDDVDRLQKELAALRAAEPAREPKSSASSFQSRVDDWLLACFGETIARDKIERNHRLLEEALEAVQSGVCTRSEAHQLVDYVFDRPVGELWQEVGGCMNTLAAFCAAHGLDMAECGERELARVWTKVEAIRAKHAAKPKHSPLPQHVEGKPAPSAEAREVVAKVREDNPADKHRRYAFKLSDAEAAALVQDYVEKEAMRRAEIMNGELQARAEAAEAKLKEALSVIEERNGQLDKADTAPEAAETKLAKAREALKPFKEWRDHIEATSSRRLADNEFAEVSGMPRMGDLRRARAALKEIGE
jgi:hypothetical protein